MTTGREHATATLLGNGRVLLAGGGNPSALASAELYNPTSGRWSATGSMNAYGGGAAALLQDGRVLVAGAAAPAMSTRPPPAPGRRPARWSTPTPQPAPPCFPTGRSSTSAAGE